MPTSFETFINNELPLRVSTLDAPVSGDIPVFTGVGKLTEAKSTSELGLATTSYVDTSLRYIPRPVLPTDNVYTVLAADVNAFGTVILQVSGSGTNTVIIGTPASLSATDGDSFTVRQETLQILSLVGSGTTLIGNLSFNSQYDARTLVASGAKWIVLGG